MKAWTAALAAAIATAAIALIVIAPLAQSSSKRHPGLKVVTASDFSFSGRAVAKCPRKYVVVGGGADTGPDAAITQFGKNGSRRWRVRTVATGPTKRGGPSAGAQAICAKGTGGFKLTDRGELD